MNRDRALAVAKFQTVIIRAANETKSVQRQFKFRAGSDHCRAEVFLGPTPLKLNGDKLALISDGSPGFDKSSIFKPLPLLFDEKLDPVMHSFDLSVGDFPAEDVFEGR